jgi:hypothetical protein
MVLRHNANLRGFSSSSNYARKWGTISAATERTTEHPPETRLFVDTGYWIYARGEDYALLDAALLGPDENPGHGHADALSVVIYRSGSEVLVDPGTFEYGSGPIREYYRSTEAHNTAVVNGAGQADFWGAFRVGRRPRPSVVTFSDLHCTATCQLKQRTGSAVEHRRTVRKTDNGWRVIDEFASTEPLPPITLGFQFSPDYALELEQVRGTFRHNSAGLAGTFRFSCDPATLRLEAHVLSRPVSRYWRQQSLAPRLAIEAYPTTARLLISFSIEYD